jgi:hypothetical protein
MGDFRIFYFVMPGLVPGIHVFLFEAKTWMAGTSPAMTELGVAQRRKRSRRLFTKTPEYP